MTAGGCSGEYDRRHSPPAARVWREAMKPCRARYNGDVPQALCPNTCGGGLRVKHCIVGIQEAFKDSTRGPAAVISAVINHSALPVPPSPLTPWRPACWVSLPAQGIASAAPTPVVLPTAAPAAACVAAYRSPLLPWPPSCHQAAGVEDLIGLPERIEEVLSTVPATCMAFNGFGTLLAAGRDGGGVALYDWQTRGVAATLKGGHPDSTHVSALLWSADGRMLLSGGDDGSLAAWDVASGLPRRLASLGGGAVVQLDWAGGRKPQPQGQEEGEVLVSLAAGPAHLLCLRTGEAQPLPMLTIGGWVDCC